MCSFFVATPRYTKHPSLNNLHNQNAPQVKNDCILIGFNKRICKFLRREGEFFFFLNPPACPSGGGYWNSLFHLLYWNALVHLSIVLECLCSSVYCTRTPLSTIYCTSETDSNSKEHELHPSTASSHI